MTLQPPGEGRARIHIHDDTLLVEIPAKSNLFVTAFMSVWLCGWLFGELSALSAILSGGPHPFMVVWLCGWTLGGAAALAMVLWNVAGRERIWIMQEGLRIERSIPVWTRSRTYDAAHISNMRTSRHPSDRRWFGQTHGGLLSGFDAGTIAFDYGRDTISFGLDLAEADASHVVDTIGPLFARREAA